MITIILFALCAYISVISVVSVVVCCYDKVAAKRWTKHRTRESTLLLLSAIGGSVAMLITMLIIRHKTKHVKFMLGLPVIILLQAAAVTAVYFLLFREKS